jgi:hypothetical protein
MGVPHHGVVREFYSSYRSDALPRGVLGLAIGGSIGLLVALLLWKALPERTLWTWMLFVLPVILFGAGGARVELMTALGSHGTSSAIVVGADGVRARGRFIPHSSISGVDHGIGAYKEGTYYDGVREPPSKEWFVRLHLVGGEEILLGTRWLDAGEDDQSGAELARAIREAHAAWAACGGSVGVDEAIITRDDRTGLEWLHHLRELGRRAGTVYRAVNIDAQQLSRLLADSQAKPSARAAAAVVLAASGNATAASKLRIAAQAMANPRPRIAFENIAAAKSDAIIAEALEILDEADQEEGRGLRRSSP